jgi:hypothetical protein
MKPRDWRNLLLAALVAALCFGGSFTCKNGDDKVDGHVTIN